jgi:hypothetical protein
MLSDGGLFMSKYAPLNEHLLGCCQERVSMTFLELEQVLGFALPESAHTYGAWWANGGHCEAHAWLGAGYKVERVDIPATTVTFSKIGVPATSQVRSWVRKTTSTINAEPVHVDPNADKMVVCGYEFRFLQQLNPECDNDGQVVRFFPQDGYDNRNGIPLSHHGEGAFCRFSINAGDWPGVYLWVVEGVILYIGETVGLKRRFNMGYGNISPRNCYIGGQSTNCKMNKVVLSLHQKGKTVSLYFYQTADYKRVELDLLGKTNTPYNAKHN